ncbi:MAG: DUF362 domain-containing protein [Archaeoglobaceae archaeon]
MEVFYVDSRAKVLDPDEWYQPNLSLVNKLKDLLDKTPVLDSIDNGDVVAVKTHFGEKGTTKTLRVQFIRAVVEKLLEIGAKPFVTETTGLGLTRLRSSAIGRLQIAEENGYTQQTLKAPIIIADGLKGFDFVEVSINGRHLKKVYVAKAIAESDAVILCTHFKLHMQSGMGGSIKNVGVGCVAKPSKFDVHASGFPEIIKEKCTKCNRCLEVCPVDAISNYRIVEERCLKCTGCYEVCEENAVKINWISGNEIVERIVECAKGVYEVKKNMVFLNFMLDITPHCDCHPYSDNAVAPDFGRLASKDMVSIDKASYEIYKELPCINDIFRGEKFWAWTSPERMISYAEEIGLGESNYKLIKVD